MAANTIAENSCRSAEIRGYFVFPRRGEHFADGVACQDLGSLRKTPKQTVTGLRGGVSAMSAITSRGRLIFRLHEKRITSAEVIDFLAQMLRHHKRRHLVVVMDQAPPHTSKNTVAFINSQPRLHVFHLPKYSPHWNPDEKVWNHLKHQELKGHQARTKAQLKQLTHDKLRTLSKDRRLLRGIFFRCCVAELLK